MCLVVRLCSDSGFINVTDHFKELEQRVQTSSLNRLAQQQVRGIATSGRRMLPRSDSPMSSTALKYLELQHDAFDASAPNNVQDSSAAICRLGAEEC